MEKERMSEESILREKAREAMRAGILPARRPDFMWGGPGSGADCTVCGAPVARSDSELEIEFSRHNGSAGGRHHLHVRCFAALEFERDRRDLAEERFAPAAQAQAGAGDASNGRAVCASRLALPGTAGIGKMASYGCIRPDETEST
jgi:hypothetical protein